MRLGGIVIKKVLAKWERAMSHEVGISRSCLFPPDEFGWG